MRLASTAHFSVELLEERHDRSSFSSGVAELDTYFQFQTRQDVKRKVAAAFALIDQSQRVIGYYTLSAHGIRLSEMPGEVVKKLPKYPVLPATLLGRLAIDREHQGRGLGQLLLTDALRRSWQNTHEIGSVGIIVEALDEGAKKFYVHHGFTPMPGDLRKLLIPMITIKKLFVG